MKETGEEKPFIIPPSSPKYCYCFHERILVFILCSYVFSRGPHAICTVVFCFPVDIILTFFFLLYGVYTCTFEIFYYLQEVFSFFLSCDCGWRVLRSTGFGIGRISASLLLSCVVTLSKSSNFLRPHCYLKVKFLAQCLTLFSSLACDHLNFC